MEEISSEALSWYSFRDSKAYHASSKGQLHIFCDASNAAYGTVHTQNAVTFKVKLRLDSFL